MNPSASPSPPFKTHNLLNSQVFGPILGSEKSFNAPLLLNSRESSECRRRRKFLVPRSSHLQHGSIVSSQETKGDASFFLLPSFTTSVRLEFLCSLFLFVIIFGCGPVWSVLDAIFRIPTQPDVCKFLFISLIYWASLCDHFFIFSGIFVGLWSWKCSQHSECYSSPWLSNKRGYICFLLAFQ